MAKKSHNDEITDERFAAAATRPQFTKAKTSLSTNYNNKNKKQYNNNNTNTKNSVDGDDGDDNGALINKSVATSSGLGDSLTRAIASDDRFSAALDSDKFGCVPTRDKYGRKTKKKSKKLRDKEDKEDSVDEDSDGEDEDDEQSKTEKKEDGGRLLEQDNSMETRIAYLNALSRGDISASSSSDDSSDGSDDDDDDDDGSTASNDIRGKAGIFDPSHAPLPGDIEMEGEEQELTFDPSPYLCILNLNWEHTRAVDVYAMLHSFCPPGMLEKVEVYPSDFGKERMEKERREGPVGLWKKEKKTDEEEEDDASEDGSVSDGESGEGDNLDNNKDAPSSYQSNNNESNSESDDVDTDSDTEEPLNLAEATSQLYSHFPPQSSISKNSDLHTPEEEEEGFDVEKLRAYEVSKLRYYFAVATFRSPSAAENAYENVDGMEMEGSAAEIDVRVLPSDQYETTVQGRTMRDAWRDQLPAKYAPPDNAETVTALRQSRVSCSWERGDAARESKLTRYGMGKEAWEALAEGDDIGFYLATSDNSSVEDNSDDEEEEEDAKKKKGSGMRALLGLAGSDGEESGDDDGSSGKSDDDSDANEAKGVDSTEKYPSKSSSTESESDSEDEDEAEDADHDADRQVTFTPGKRALEAKIRSKLSQKSGRADEARAGGDTATTTPFEKYLEKRKEKRKERRKAARGGAKDDSAEEGDDDGGMYGVDPEFGAARFSDEEGDEGEVGGGGSDGNDNGGDGFFLGDSTKTTQKGKQKKKQQSLSLENSVEDAGKDKVASTKEELELLIAGDDVEEHEKDYDMRGLAKLERNATKKLKGKRKRKLQTLASNLPGQGFQVNASDDRFAALLDGSDDRYGIDRTNPAYKETGAMKTLLEEQSKRRRGVKGVTSRNDGGGGKERKKKDGVSASSENKDGGGWVEHGSGAMELSSLVKSLQRKVPKKSADGSKRKKKKKA